MFQLFFKFFEKIFHPDSENKNSFLNLHDFEDNYLETEKIDSQEKKVNKIILNKDQKIDELETNLKILQQSLNELTFDYQKNMIEKNDINEEMCLLQTERDLLLWKLTNNFKANALNDIENMTIKNLHVINETLEKEIKNLKENLDLYSNRNLELKVELGRKTEIDDLFKQEYEITLANNNKMLLEIKNLNEEIAKLKENQAENIKENINKNTLKKLKGAAGTQTTTYSRIPHFASSISRAKTASFQNDNNALLTNSSSENLLNKRNHSKRMPPLSHQPRSTNKVKDIVTTIQKYEDKRNSLRNGSIGNASTASKTRIFSRTNNKTINDFDNLRTMLQNTLGFPTRTLSNRKGQPPSPVRFRKYGDKK